jgi:hypothetical protein
MSLKKTTAIHEKNEMTCDLEMHEGVMFAGVDGQTLLIDTGSPVSFANRDIVINGTKYHVSRDLKGDTAEQLSEKIGFRIDGLIGADILQQYDFAVDYCRKTLVFGSGLDPEGARIPLHSVMGFPYGINLDFQGHSLSCYLDTGASISHLPLKNNAALTYLEEYQDFNPVLGKFTTPLYEGEVSIGNSKLPVRVGKPVQLLESMLSLMGVDGVLGIDLFRRFRVTFKSGESAMYMIEHDA